MSKRVTQTKTKADLDIAGAMRVIRERKGMTQGDVYRATDRKLERSYLSRMETGQVEWPKLRTLYEWCRAVGITLSEFIEVAEEEWKKKNKKRKK